jgi:SOS response regulatory protein OraA/RecX
VDDARYAAGRAALLAGRGYGNTAIRWDLERRGIDAGVVAGALAGLEPELERARALVAARGGGARAAALLARRGFGEDALEAVRDLVGADDPGQLGWTP